MSLPTVSDLALKEWAVAVKSLGRGEQVLILRKAESTAKTATFASCILNSCCIRHTSTRGLS